jgi:hypothetical protein
MKIKKITALLTVLCLFLALLTACGDTPSENAPTPTTPTATTTPPATTTAPPPPPEPECEHDWTEANYQQPEICTVCGETQGNPLTPFFEENGFAVNMVLGETYPYRTRTPLDFNVTSVGELTITDYRIIESDDEHEAKEGYEWRIIQWQVVFYDENVQYGVARFCFVTIDYYIDSDFELNQDARISADAEDIYSVNFYGEEKETLRNFRTIRSELVENDWFVEAEYSFLVPIGYDGVVPIFFNAVHNGEVAGIGYGNVEHWTDIIDDDALLFRLD